MSRPISHNGSVKEAGEFGLDLSDDGSAFFLESDSGVQKVFCAVVCYAAIHGLMELLLSSDVCDVREQCHPNL